MTRRFACSIVFAALLAGVVPLAGGLDIDGGFELGNLGFTPTRTSTDTSFPGADYFWGGSLSLRQDMANSIQVEGVLERDQITGNSLSALFQYQGDNFRVGMGSFFGFLNSPAAPLKSGISTIVGLQLPGIAFASLRSDSSLAGLASTPGDYFVQSNELRLGFYVRAAICTFGLTYKQRSLAAADALIVDALTDYSFDVRVFEKNIPFRLDFAVDYQALLKQYVDGVTNPKVVLESIIIGAGIDLIITKGFVLTLDFRTSVLSLGSGVLSGTSDFGFAPFLFQASAGFEVVVRNPSGPAGTL